MSEIDPGDGFRLIDKEKDTPKLGDQYHNGKAWFDRPSPLTPFSSFDTYRRKLPALPNVLDIQSEGGSISLETIPRGPVWLIQRWEDSRDEVRLDTTEQIRQVIAWLQQVADWREEQNANEKGSN
jgi:hypothetical protein